MSQMIITVFEDGTQKHPGFGSFGTHTFRKDERDFVGEPSFWEEKTYSIERRMINHDFPQQNISLQTGVPFHKIQAMGLLHRIKDKKEGSLFGQLKSEIRRLFNRKN